MFTAYKLSEVPLDICEKGLSFATILVKYNIVVCSQSNFFWLIPLSIPFQHETLGELSAIYLCDRTLTSCA